MKQTVSLRRAVEGTGYFSLGPRASRPHQAVALILRVQVPVFTGTAGVSPASSIKFTQVTAESINSDKVAFNESGRDEHPSG